MGKYQSTGKVRRIKVKLIGVTTDDKICNCWKFHVKVPIFSNWAKINVNRSPSFDKFGEHLTIFDKKIPSIRIQITGENKKFQNEFNQIRLKVQFEVKMREEKKTSERENFTILHEKLSSIRSETTGEKMHHFKVNSIEDSNRRTKLEHFQEKIYQTYTKFHPFWQEKIRSIRIEITGELKEIWLKIEIGERKKKRHLRDKILDGKFRWIRIEMTGENEEFQGQFREIRLKI